MHHPNCRNCNDDGYFYTHNILYTKKREESGERTYEVGMCYKCKAGERARRALKLMGVKMSGDIAINPKAVRFEGDNNSIVMTYNMTRKQLDMLEKMNVERETD